MERYTEEKRPERDYYASEDEDFDDLNKVYSFLRHWAATVKLDLKPPITAEVAASSRRQRSRPALSRR